MNAKEIKNTLSLEKLLSYYYVQKASNNLYYCPFHEQGGKKRGHNASLVTKNQSVICMSAAYDCLNGSTDIFGFIAKKEGLDCKADFAKVREKALEIAGIGKISFYETKRNQAPRFSGINELDEHKLAYLKHRGISAEVAHEFNLKAKSNYILFPQTKDGNFVGYKGLSVPRSDTEKSKMFFDTKESPVFWYEPFFHKNRDLIFVEGEKDYLRLHEQLRAEAILDRFTIISMPYGASFVPHDLLSYLTKLSPKSIYIAYDNDEAGELGSRKLRDKLFEAYSDISIIKFPKDKPKGYDLSDFLNEGHKLNDLMNLEIEKAQSRPSIFSKGEKFFSCADLVGPPEQISWLIEGFLAKNRLGVLVSTGGVGKSWFLLQLAFAIATGGSFMGMKNPNSASRVLFISGEEDRADIHRRIVQIQGFYKEYLYSSFEQKNFQNLSFYCARGTSLLLEKGCTTLIDLEKYIDEKKPALVILDPMIRFFNGDENSSTQMTRFIEVLESFVSRGTTVLFAHHSSKIFSSQLDQHSSRGSSAIIDGVRWNFTMHSIANGSEGSYIFEDSGEELTKHEREKYICGSITKCNSFKPDRQHFTFIRTSYGPLALSQETLIKRS